MLKRINWWLAGLILLAAFTHFIFLSYPSEVVFDEFYFGKFASAYLTKSPYFDIHPPLGKMLLASAGWIFNIEPNCTFEEIGHACAPNIFFALRFLPALFGTLLIILFYAFIKLLTGSKKIALLGGFLLVFENAFLLQSRHILLDIFLIFFGLLGVYLFLKASSLFPILPHQTSPSRREGEDKPLPPARPRGAGEEASAREGDERGRIEEGEIGAVGASTARADAAQAGTAGTATAREGKRWLFSVLSGLSLGACISIKWTGLGFAAVVFFLMLLYLAEQKINFKKFLKIGVVLAACTLFVYLLQFWLHFSLIPGGGDVDSFLTENFQELTFLQKIAKINITMFSANQSIDASHPANSRFYQWPLMLRSISLWEGGQTIESKIKLAGNPVIWWLSSFGILILIVSLFFKKIRKGIYPSVFLVFFILVGFFLNLLPFILISRATFIYHYFPAYIFAILNLAILLNWLSQHNKKLFWIILLLIVVGFVINAPQTYGFQSIFSYIQI